MDIIGTSTYYSKKFFSLITRVMDDNHDTYTTAISKKINQFVFERLINVLNFFELHLTCEIYIFERVNRIRSAVSTVVPVPRMPPPPRWTDLGSENWRK
jgi:hypothetical protein